MEKIDFKKDLKTLYNCKQEPVLVTVPEMQYFMIDGKGDPNSSKDYQESIEALFSLSYNIKFYVKKNYEIDYGVLPLEGLWWMEDMSQFTVENKDEWLWTAMIMQPKFVNEEIFELCKKEVAKKKNLPKLEELRFEKFEEGKSAQIMHIGPFINEGPTVERLHSFIDSQNLKRSKKHHEIYLSDFRKASPEKLKTIIRQPVVS